MVGALFLLLVALDVLHNIIRTTTATTTTTAEKSSVSLSCCGCLGAVWAADD